MNNDIPADAAESAPPADPVVAGETYIHWKHGREYVVEAIALGNSDPFVGLDIVVYRPLHQLEGAARYARTPADFTALVPGEGRAPVRRFRMQPRMQTYRRVPIIRTFNANGPVIHYFCRELCARRSELGGDHGVTPADWVMPGTPCETCGRDASVDHGPDAVAHTNEEDDDGEDAAD